MRAHVRYPLALAASFLWIGFIGSISFMEAWLKFQAPGVTVPLGLGIGRLVFSALNKVEWVLALIILGSFLLGKARFSSPRTILYVMITITLTLQTIWLLPALGDRVVLLQQGQELENSYLHLYYIVLEISKVICLSLLGIKLFNR